MWLLLLACADPLTAVVIEGKALDLPGISGLPVPGAAIETRDGAGAPYDAVTADEKGRFSAELRQSSAFTVTGSAAGFVPTAFAGLAGLDSIAIPNGFFYLRSAEQLTTLREEHDACAAAASPGAVVEGEARLFINIDPDDYDTLPLITTAEITAEGADGAIYAACYFNDAGESDAAATVTGDTGRFAIFGLPAGLTTVRSTYTIGDEAQDETAFTLWLEADGAAPLYPHFVASP